MTTDAYTTLRYRDPAQSWTDALPLGNGRLGAMCFGGVELDRFQLNEGSCWSGSPATTLDDISAAGAGALTDGPSILRAARSALAAGDVRAAEDELARLRGGHSQAYQPLADLWIEQRRPEPVPDGYVRHLDLRTAVASHTYRTATGRVSQEAWISAPAQAMVIRRRTQEDLPLLIRLDSPHPTAVTQTATGGLDLVVRMPSDIGTAEPAVYDPAPGAAVTAVIGLRVLSGAAMTVVDGPARSERTAGPDGSRLTGARPQDAPGTARSLRLDGAGELIVVVCVATDYLDPLTAPHGDVAALRRTVDERLAVLANALVRPGGYPALRAAHERAHSRLFSRASLRLGPPRTAAPQDTGDRIAQGDPSLAALQFQYGRYLLISSSRPGGLPATLQGLWNDHLRPPWSSNYTTNINLEMNYWPAEVANLPECHQPLLDWLGSAAHRGAPMVRNLYGTSGWTLHHNSDAWCFCLPADGDASWSSWPLAGAWLTRQITEHHDYTGDLQLWPLLREAAVFCLDWLVALPDGTLGTSPATSPENKFVAADGRPAAASVSTTADLVLIRDLLASVVRLGPAGDPVGVRARAALSRLPTERVAPDGRIAEWSGEVADAEPEHRHTSHLIGLYPGHSIDPLLTPELAAAAGRTLDARGPESTGWSLAWRIALRARLHDAPAAYEAVQRFLGPAIDRAGVERSGVYRNLFCAHPPFQIDGNFGFTAGVAEMLLQSHASTESATSLHLLPALPADWAEGAFAGLRARGGVTVDAEWADGRVGDLRLLSDTDRTVVIREGSRQLEVQTSAHVPLRLTGAL